MFFLVFLIGSDKLTFIGTSNVSRKPSPPFYTVPKNSEPLCFLSTKTGAGYTSWGLFSDLC